MTDEKRKISLSFGECSIAGKSVPDSLNEDSLASFLKPVSDPDKPGIKGVFCVADGFGGAGLGNSASRETANLLNNVFSTGEYLKWAKTRNLDINNFSGVLNSAVTQINYVINDYAVKHKRLMGTCIDLLVFKDNRFYTSHVGNGRIYLLRKGVLYRLTQDHPAETGRGEVDPSANVLGKSQEVTIDLFEDNVIYGDAFVLCSDGITKAVDDEEIKYALINFEKPQECAEKLARLADKRDGTDNISVIVIKTAAPLKEEKLPVRRVPIPDIKMEPRFSPRLKTAGKIALILIAVFLTGFLTYRFIFKAPKPQFIVEVNPDNTVRLTIQNIVKDDQFYIYRQENKPFSPESDDLPDTPDMIGPLTKMFSSVTDDTVEPGKIYYYTAYRIKPGWQKKIDLSSQMTERAVTGGIAAPEEEETTYAGKITGDDSEKFTRIYNRFVRLGQDYGNPLSAQQRDKLLDTVREHKKIIEEISGHIKELKLIEDRNDLVINNKNPKMLSRNLEELKNKIENVISKEGFEPYLASLREQAVNTDFAYAPFADIASLVSEIDNTAWKDYESELQLLIKLIIIERDMRSGFKPDNTIEWVVESEGIYPQAFIADFFSSETLKKPETLENFYKNNKKLSPNEPVPKGTKIIIANPEYEIGGLKLLKRREDLIGESSPYYYAIKYAGKINNKNLSDEYKEIIELYRLKTLYWYEINNKSKKMEENLRNIDTEGKNKNRFYQNSYLRKTLIAPLIGPVDDKKVETDDVEIQNRIRNTTAEFETLRKFFEQEDLDADPEKFDEAVNSFKVLKKMVMAEDDPRFDVLKELFSSYEANIKLLSVKIKGDIQILIQEADDLFESAGESKTAREFLEKAKSLYEKALDAAESEEKKKEIEAKIKTVDERIIALEQSAIDTVEEKTGTIDIAKLRRDKELTNLSLAELAVFIERLSDDSHEAIKKLKKENIESYNSEYDSATKRFAELISIAGNRIIQKIEPLGPDFDEKKLGEGLAEFRVLSFAVLSIITNDKISGDFKPMLETLSEQIKDSILKNHLTFETAYKKFRKEIVESIKKGDSEIKAVYGDILDSQTLNNKLSKVEYKTYSADILMFAEDIAERTEKNIWGRGDSFFVELALMPKRGEVLVLSRKLWDEGLPLLRLKFHTDKITKEKSYLLAIGWYKNRGYAEKASSEISQNKDLMDLTFSVTVKSRSEY